MGPVPAMKVLLFAVLLAGALAAPSRKPTFRRGLNKIVPGSEVTPGELPYQLSFQDVSFGFAFHFCGASIYNENWAICAGHCVQGEDMTSLLMKATSRPLSWRRSSSTRTTTALPSAM